MSTITRTLLALQFIIAASISPRAAIPQFLQTRQPFCYDAGGNGVSCASAAPSSPATITSIWGGARHLIVLKSDGTVWDWGYNWNGDLGDGTVIDRYTPVQVHGPGNVGFLTGIKAIMGGESHNFALKMDGTVWAWGWNVMGQLGDGTFNTSYTPVQVSGLSSITALGGRGYHSLAIENDGTVWAWGDNSNGQLGHDTSAVPCSFPNGSSVNCSNVPVQVIGLSGVLAVTGGGFFSLALMPDYTLSAWGSNKDGQLGIGSFTDQPAPKAVSGLTNVLQVSAGWFHATAVKTDGTVWTWGVNDKGELGDGTTTKSNVPIHVNGLTNVIQVSAGDCQTAALKSDGTVWSWGCNERDELGDGTSIDRHTPVQVHGLSNVIAIAARDYHNVALKSDGTLWTWGWNINGQLGDNTVTDRSTPVQVLFNPKLLYLPLIQ